MRRHHHYKQGLFVTFGQQHFLQRTRDLVSPKTKKSVNTRCMCPPMNPSKRFDKAALLEAKAKVKAAKQAEKERLSKKSQLIP